MLAARLERWLSGLTVRRAVVLIMGVAATLAVGAAMLEWAVDPGINTFGDALWWAIVTVGTVGYGDVVPTSTAGRLVGAALILVAMGIIPTITSAVVSALVARRSAPERAETQQHRAEILDRLAAIEVALGVERVPREPERGAPPGP